MVRSVAAHDAAGLSSFSDVLLNKKPKQGYNRVHFIHSFSTDVACSTDIYPATNTGVSGGIFAHFTLFVIYVATSLQGLNYFRRGLA